jgi:hypothetical protein
MLKKETQSNQVQTYGMNAFPARLARMLYRVGVYAETMHLSIRRIAVLTRENVTERCPAARRGLHVAVCRAGCFWEHRSTTRALLQRHTEATYAV